MSLLDEFEENTKIFKAEEGRLDQAAFEKLVQEQGIDVARGYLKAVHEIGRLVGGILMTPVVEAGQRPYVRLEGSAKVHAKVSNLHEALFNFIRANGLEVIPLEEPVPRRNRIQGW